MKKLILFLSILITLLLSACSTPAQLAVVDYDVSYTDIDVYDEDIYVRLFRLYLPNNQLDQEYNYGFQVKTNKSVTISYTCSDDVVYTNNINVLFYKNYTQSISPNFFVGKCNENDELIVQVIDKSDDILYSHSIDYLSTRAVYFTEDTFPPVPTTEFNNWNYAIVIIPILLLFIASIFSYKIYYKRKINASFQDEHSNIEKIMDLNTYIKLATVVSILLMLIIPIFVKIIYDKTIIQNIAYEERTLGVLDMDLSNITLSSIRYERIIVSSDEEGRITKIYPPFELELAISYTEVSDNVLSILNDYNTKPVLYEKWYNHYFNSFLIPTEKHYIAETSRHYIIQLTTIDEATVIFKFTVSEYGAEEFKLEVYYLPPYQSHYVSNEFMPLYFNPVYSFTVPNNNQNVIELYNTLINSE